VCIVTGGNSGLGYAVAGYLAQAGVESVIIACKNATAGKSAAQKINLYTTFLSSPEYISNNLIAELWESSFVHFYNWVK